MEVRERRDDPLEIRVPRLWHGRAGDGARAAVAIDHHDDLRLQLRVLLQPRLRPHQAVFFRRKANEDDRALRFGARCGNQANRFHPGSVSGSIVDAARPAAEAVEVGADDDEFVGIGRAAQRGHDVVVLDRAHLEPVADVELELDGLVLRDQRRDLFELGVEQLDVGQHRQPVPRRGVAVEQAERRLRVVVRLRGRGRRRRLDRPERASIDQGLGKRRNQVGIQVLGRPIGKPGGAAAVTAKAGVTANQHPRALEGGLIGVDLGNAFQHGGAFLVDVLLGHGLAAGGSAGHRKRVGLEHNDASALNAFGAGGKAGRPEPQRFLGGLEHLAEPWAAVEADRDFAHLFELRIEPELFELPDGPLGGVGVRVGARLAPAKPVAGEVVPGHDLVVPGAKLDDPGDHRVGLPLGERLETDRGAGHDQEIDQPFRRACFHKSSDAMRAVNGGADVTRA